MRKVIHFIRAPFSLKKKALIQKHWNFLCTISSGQDSTFAFFLLLHLNLKNSLQLLYCNHFWQLKNFLTIRELYQLSYFTNVSYNVIFPKKAVLTENKAREWRKTNFGRFSQLQHIPYIITGHSETDILEKNLNNICRGTSLRSFSTVNLVASERTLNRFFFRLNTNRTLNQFPFSKLNKQTTQFASKSSKTGILLFVPNNSLKQKKRGVLNKNKFYFSTRNKVTNPFFLTKRKFGLNFKNEPLSKIFFCSDSKTSSYSFCFSSECDSVAKNLLKPLHTVKRVTISKIINLYSLPLIVDFTNFSSNFSRNKIRHQLIPLSEFLLFRNIESLLINFFQTVEFSTADQEHKRQEFYFVSDFLLITPEKKKKFRDLLIKKLIPQISRNKTQHLIQKLFFDSKHVTLSFSQLITITKLLVTPLFFVLDFLVSVRA